ncbi:MAG: hypothetical protein ACLFPD_00360, partial [Desulfosudaceae bacterium]
LGHHRGRQGLERLLRETERLAAEKSPVVIALAGCPGCGKTFLAKCFTRFGFGPFPRKAVTVIDDNIIYTTRFWRLHWEKIKPEKESWRHFVDSRDCRVLFFSNWIPSRFTDFADILVQIKVEEPARIARLRRRYRRRPDKLEIQKKKTTIPTEEPFAYEVMMTYSDPCGETRRWAMANWLKRWLARPFSR